MSQKARRETNLEIFRILAMLGIIAAHYVNNSGLIAADGPIYAAPLSWRSLFLLVFGAWGKIGINCFVLITGYFMCTSRITAKKFVKLLAEVMFYRLAINAIFWITGYETFRITDFVKSLIPVTDIARGFTNAYLAFYLCIPFLNVLVRNLTEKQHVYLLGFCFLTYVLLGTIPVFSITMNYMSWFIVIYFIASFIRLHPHKCFSNAKLWKAAALVSVILTMGSVVGCAWLGIRIHTTNAHAMVANPNTLLSVFTGTSLFMAFKNMSIRHSKAINTVAASTFGVFLIHTRGDAMRRWLWEDLLDSVGHYGAAAMPLYAVGCVLGIFIVCTLIDMIRIRCLETPFFRLWDRHWDSIRDKYRRIEDKVFSGMDIHEQEQ